MQKNAPALALSLRQALSKQTHLMAVSKGWPSRGATASWSQMIRADDPFGYVHSSPDVIRMVVMLYVHYPLSLRNVEDCE